MERVCMCISASELRTVRVNESEDLHLAVDGTDVDDGAPSTGCHMWYHGLRHPDDSKDVRVVDANNVLHVDVQKCPYKLRQLTCVACER